MMYVKLVVEAAEEHQESLIAELFAMGFIGSEQRKDRIITYIEKKQFTDSQKEDVEQLLAAYPGNGSIESKEVIAEQNWNQQWEQTIKAQTIGSFFVKPSWSTRNCPNDKIQLEIDPKMSFGTGYHETTQLMLEALPSLVNSGDMIIDAGTGTGILAIAAAKMGAAGAFAFDISEWSVTNAKENVAVNDVSGRVTVEEGGADKITESLKADVLLANIEANVILPMVPDFKKALKPDGRLLLSGLLQNDKQSARDRLADDFEIINISQKNRWISIRAKYIVP